MKRGKNRASVNQKDKEGFTPLHRAAEAGHAHIVKVLVERGANVDVATDTGFTALCLAAKEGYEPIVRILANANANVERADLAYGCTPLLWAVQNARGAEVTKFLCEKGADTETKSRVSGSARRRAPAPARRARRRQLAGPRVVRGASMMVTSTPCRLRRPHRARTRISRAPSQFGYTALMYAAQLGSMEKVKALLAAGADAKAKDSVRYVCLYLLLRRAGVRRMGAGGRRAGALCQGNTAPAARAAPRSDVTPRPPRPAAARRHRADARAHEAPRRGRGPARAGGAGPAGAKVRCAGRGPVVATRAWLPSACGGSRRLRFYTSRQNNLCAVAPVPATPLSLP